jgi:hypothetical protein
VLEGLARGDVIELSDTDGRGFTAVARSGLLCVILSAPASLGFPAVEAVLDGLVRQHPGSSWLYGNVDDPWKDFRPLGWWDNPPHWLAAFRAASSRLRSAVYFHHGCFG